MNNIQHVFREYRTLRFRVMVAAHWEDVDPADTVAFDDLEAERKYVDSIKRGDIPWYCLGVHVFLRVPRHPPIKIGSSYLGCVDARNPRDVGLIDVAREAISAARDTLAVARGEAS